jgi:MFS family permease
VLFDREGMTDPYQNSFIYASGNIPGNIISLLIMDRFSRKNILAGSLFCSSVSALMFSFAYDQGKGFVVFCAFLFSLFTTPAWNSLESLSSESFPTESRSAAMGLLSSGGRVGSIIAQVCDLSICTFCSSFLQLMFTINFNSSFF